MQKKPNQGFLNNSSIRRSSLLLTWQKGNAREKKRKSMPVDITPGASVGRSSQDVSNVT